MKLDFKSPRLYLFSSLIAAIPAIPLQLAAYLTAYNSADTNYFLAKSPLPTLATAFSILSCLLAIAAIVLWKNEPIAVKRPSGSLATFPAALGFLIGGTLMLLSNTEKLTYVLPVFCFLAAIYNVAIIFVSEKLRAIVALIGFSTVVACILFCGYYYFDTRLEMNAPLKVTVQVALLVSMVYFISELRTLLDMELPRVYLLSCALTVAITSLTAIPVPFAYLLGTFKPEASKFASSYTEQLFEHPEYLAGAVVALGIFATVAWKLCLTLSAKDGKEDV